MSAAFNMLWFPEHIFRDVTTSSALPVICCYFPALLV